MEDKRPIKYVSRRVRVKGLWVYIVSQAYVYREIKTYQPDGTYDIKYSVDYCDHMDDKKDIEHLIPNDTHKISFDDYASCKERVKMLNQQLLERRMQGVMIENNQEIINNFKQIISIANQMEKRYLKQQSNNLNI